MRHEAGVTVRAPALLSPCNQPPFCGPSHTLKTQWRFSKGMWAAHRVEPWKPLCLDVNAAATPPMRRRRPLSAPLAGRGAPQGEPRCKPPCWGCFGVARQQVRVQGQAKRLLSLCCKRAPQAWRARTGVEGWGTAPDWRGASSGALSACLRWVQRGQAQRRPGNAAAITGRWPACRVARSGLVMGCGEGVSYHNSQDEDERCWPRTAPRRRYYVRQR
jgi:hypothetical protein